MWEVTLTTLEGKKFHGRGRTVQLINEDTFGSLQTVVGKSGNISDDIVLINPNMAAMVEIHQKEDAS